MAKRARSEGLKALFVSDGEAKRAKRTRNSK
jgi:hypothetical protein